MTETRIAFLCKAASTLSAVNINKTQEILKSYYMMRCKELSKGYGLPQKHFSDQVRCSHCCLEWRKQANIHIKPIKISKRQRKRIKMQKKVGVKVHKEHLLHSNEVEKKCSFCGHREKTVILKASKPDIIKPQKPAEEIKVTKKQNNTNDKNNTKQICNVYNNTAQAFSLKNQKNTIKCKVKEEPKIIKNNKKKKDKFAGLCKKAVLASAKLKHNNNKKDKLQLFLKPSS